MKDIDPVDGIIWYLKKHGAITNRGCRELLGLSYDQAIRFLGGLCKIGLLTRKGIASGTHYTLPGKRVPLNKLRRFTDEFMKRVQ